MQGENSHVYEYAVVSRILRVFVVGQDNFQQTIILGERALGYLKYNETPAIPRNYELWYTYAGGYNKELIAEIQKLLSQNSHLTPEDTDKLYEMFLSPSRMTEQMEEVSSNIGEELKSVIEAMQSAQTSVHDYGSSLDNISGELTDLNDPNKLRSVVTTLLQTTKDMAQNSHALEARLEESQKHISELHHSIEVIRAESMTDQLTGIANRKRFDQVINNEVKAAQETNAPLCLLLADIDFFKKFNDTYGHQTGDQVLRLVAHTLKTNVKGQDLAARYGGEEFAIILPNTELENAKTVAEQIRSAVLGKELVKKSTGENLGRISLSIGVAQCKQGESVAEFINRADICLYAAKNAGRNQVKSETDQDVKVESSAA